MHVQATTTLNAQGLRIGMAVSRYHAEITESMANAARLVFLDAGGREDDLLVVPAAGSFELTALCRCLAMLDSKLPQRSLDAVVALGCLITGQTAHDLHIAQSVTQGLTAITVQTGMPVAFGVLTCASLELARARSVEARPELNKGAEAMRAAIETVQGIRWIESGGRR